MSSTTTAPDVGELGLVLIREIPARCLVKSPENDLLYKPIDPRDPEIIALAESIAMRGVQEPLIVTADYYVASGHRRLAAAKLVGLERVPCRVLDFDKDDDPDRFITFLRECNRQRVKTFAETLREQVIDIDPDISYQQLIDHREEKSRVNVKTIRMNDASKRAKISAAKEPFLRAIQNVLDGLQEFLPVSARQIHYNLLNVQPLRHASKPDSVYCNDDESYKSLIDLLTRARVAGIIDMEAIADATRPVILWDVHADAGQFIEGQLSDFCKYYHRDYMQSQPNHIEIIGEKNTIVGTIRPIAGRYGIPITIGRGYCSLRPRHDIVERFRKSGKDRLILLVLSDFDPDGEVIAESFARLIRDDFEVSEIVPVKVALTPLQVKKLRLPPGGKAKKTSTNYKKFLDHYGNDVWELEAVEPTALQEILTAAIDSVVDSNAFNNELDREREESAGLAGVRQLVIDAMQDYREYEESEKE